MKKNIKFLEEAMRLCLRAVVFALFAIGSASITYATDYVEPGRIGVEAIVTPYVFQGGLNYVNDFIDVGLDVQGGHSVITNSFMGAKRQDNTLGTVFRVGKRFNIHDYNYLVLGGSVSNSFGNQGPVSMTGYVAAGPYIALQRHFPNSPLMLNFFIMPYAYVNIRANDGYGNLVTETGHVFMAQGGAGLSYLF